MQLIRHYALMFFCGLSFVLFAADPVRAEPETALEAYVRAADASYGYQPRQSRAMFGSEMVELTLTSQTWRGITWRHQLFVIKPAQLTHPDRMVLVIAGGRWRDAYAEPAGENEKLPGAAAMIGVAAQRFGSPVAVLLQVPFQPMFDGKREDQIIAHTFDRYLETGDETWPVLFPMVKSAVRAMDALQDFAHKQWELRIDGFTVTGASKRGWTTWLTGAADDRVKAIAPMVIDMLNMPVQMEHQLASWGAYSPRIHDYTDLHIQDRMDSERGRALCRMVDPYAYRDRMTMPKLIVLGTNDPFWPVDALEHYWDALPGPKFVCQTPNAGHGLDGGMTQVIGAIAAAHHFACGSLTMPDLTWQYDQADGQLTMTLRCDQPAKVTTWQADSLTRDFREATWTAHLMPRKDDGYRQSWPHPAAGHRAVFAELTLDDAGAPYLLATPVKVFGAATER